jgi:O-methyltransferase
MTPGVPRASSSPRDLYLDLMKKCLTHGLWHDVEDRPVDPPRRLIPRLAFNALVKPSLEKKARRASLQAKIEGRTWPEFAHTMIGYARLDNIEACVRTALEEGVPGDLIETGVWRGGACIFMRAILAAYGVTDRTVWVADSFRGLPPPDLEKAPQDKGDNLHKHAALAVSLSQVQANFRSYGLLDDQVRFLEGWFRDTLPSAPVQRLAVARLDGDMYESTMDALESLYPKLSPGGFLIVDDYNDREPCKQAVQDYRKRHGIVEKIVDIDWSGAFWRRGK